MKNNENVFSKTNLLKMKEKSVNIDAKFFLVRDFRDVMKEELGLPENTDMDRYLNRMRAGDPDNVGPGRSAKRKNHRSCK
jgi:hypothetical protein